MKKKVLRRLLCWFLGCERQVQAVWPLDERADDCDADVRCIRCGTVRRYQGRGDSWWLVDDGSRVPVEPPRRVVQLLTRAWIVKRVAIETLATRGRRHPGAVEDTVP